METFSNGVYGISCNTVGCVIGHSVRLNPRLFASFHHLFGYIEWSEEFTGLCSYSFEWSWCFSGQWADIDNTVKGAISRIEAVLESTVESHPDYDRFDKALVFFTV